MYTGRTMFHLLEKILGKTNGSSLVLVGQPSCDGVTTKMFDGVDVLHQPALQPHLFLLG